jgi:Tfp pilus assembly protein PilZ
MEPNPENRNKTRFIHESPITLENMDVGGLRTARMYNFSDFGLYFEADFLLQPETEIHIGITNSPFCVQSDTCTKPLRGIVRWRKKLKKSSFYYGYGVELIENAFAEINAKADLELRKHPRKTCSIPLKYETKSLLYQGIIENLSQGGLFIKTQNSVAVGQRIKVAIPLPLNKDGKLIKIIGIVAWSNPVGFGVKFLCSD